MGYQVKIKFREIANEESDESIESPVQEKTKRIGKQDDDRDDNLLAQELLYWTFRRDIEVISIDVIEFVRKPIKVSIQPDGVRIRGKKYTIRQAVTSSEDPQQPTQPSTIMSKATTPSTVIKGHHESPQNTHEPIGSVVCNPGELSAVHPNLIDLLARAGFRIGNTYKLLSRKASDGANPEMLTLISDNGEVKEVNGDFFDALPQGLSNMQEDQQETTDEPRLSFSGVTNAEMPVLRG